MLEAIFYQNKHFSHTLLFENIKNPPQKISNRH